MHGNQARDRIDSVVSILHISDLHRDTGSALTTKSLLESLRLDQSRYQSVGIPPPDLVVVSGDIVYGVTSNSDESDTVLKAQYAEAADFLIKLAELFFEGNRERVIIAPGNHDVSHPHVLRQVFYTSLSCACEPLSRVTKPGSPSSRHNALPFAPTRVNVIFLVTALGPLLPLAKTRTRHSAHNILRDCIWTPPHLQTFRFLAVRYDCSRIFGF